MSDDLPSNDVLALMVAPLVEAGLREESWRQWGIVEYGLSRPTDETEMQERERFRNQFRQECEP